MRFAFSGTILFVPELFRQLDSTLILLRTLSGSDSRWKPRSKHLLPEKAQDSTGDKPADMRGEGDTALLQAPEGQHRADQLEHEPYPQHDQRRHLAHDHRLAHRNQSRHAVAREHHQVSAQYARDGARSAEGWDLAGGVQKGMRGCGSKTAEDVEEQIQDVTKSVFYIVTKDPQVEHIADQMHPTRMHKHGAHQIQEVISADAIGIEQVGWHEYISQQSTAKGLLSLCHQWKLVEHKDQHIYCDQQDRHNRKATTHRVVITHWNHRAYLQLTNNISLQHSNLKQEER